MNVYIWTISHDGGDYEAHEDMAVAVAPTEAIALDILRAKYPNQTLLRDPLYQPPIVLDATITNALYIEEMFHYSE